MKRTLTTLVAIFGLLIVGWHPAFGATKDPKPKMDAGKAIATTKAQMSGSEKSATLSEEDKRALKELFRKGYKNFSKENYKAAMEYFHQFMEKTTADVEDYEWAEFFFGISLKKQGFSHASIDTLSHLVTRKPNPRIVSYSLELFEEVIRTSFYDEDLLINNVLGDQEYGFIEGEVADFVHFYQGVYDWEHGFYQWGNDHFNKIKPWTYYFFRYLYKQALYNVYQDRIDDAIDILDQILKNPKARQDLKDEVKKTLARLLYEKGEYENADFMYSQIQLSILEQSENLLERAWAHYRIGNPEKAMGLLYSFEAPSFRNAFKPEYYILKSFIYKDVCHYQRALRVVSEFKNRYGNALENIYKREQAEDNHALMLVLLSKPNINKTYRFLNLLESEKKACTTLKEGPLREYLEKIYAFQIEESKSDLREKLDDEYEKIANDLLQYEEEAHLMEYEIGLDMYQRVYQYHYSEDEETEVEEESERGIAIYNFQGEFWNDELATYQVTLPNKCKNLEEWDIFFK